MIAVIPAAGKGTRLAKDFPDTPKALVSVNGKPMICRLIEQVSPLWADRIIVVVQEAQEELFRDALRPYSSGEVSVMPIEFCVQVEQLGLGHAVFCALDPLGEAQLRACPTFVMNGDTFADCDPQQFIGQAMISNGSLISAMHASEGSSGIVTNPSPTELRRPAKVESVAECGLSVPYAMGGWYYFKDSYSLYLTLHALLYALQISSSSEVEELSLADVINLLVVAGQHFLCDMIRHTFDMGTKAGYDTLVAYLKTRSL